MQTPPAYSKMCPHRHLHGPLVRVCHSRTASVRGGGAASSIREESIMRRTVSIFLALMLTLLFAMSAAADTGHFHSAVSSVNSSGA